MKVLTQEEFLNLNRSTSFQGYISATFSELIEILGEPTYNLSDVLDKSNFEWCISFSGNVFTIYDWKSSAAYSIQDRNLWHLGAEWRGNDITPSTWFQSELNKHLANLRNKSDILAADLKKNSRVKKIGS